MFSFIPPQYQIAALVGGIFLTATISFTAGWKVNGYRLDADHAEKMAKCTEVNTDLNLKLEKQNSAVDKLTIERWAANQRYEDEQKRFNVMKQLMDDREKKAKDIKPITCGQMIEALKELPR